MFRNSFQEERLVKDSKLQAVFSKLAGVLPQAEDLGGNANPKIMSSDIIESVFADSPVPQATWNLDLYTISSEESDCLSTISALSHRLECELRSAKRTHLDCGEVLLPCGLLQRISRDIIAMAECEPCGLRGCKLYILFESTGTGNGGGCYHHHHHHQQPQQQQFCTKLSTVQCDLTTTPTFELYLTLKQSSTGWNFIPQFLRNLTRGGTVVISPAYTLSKKKLYRSYSE